MRSHSTELPDNRFPALVEQHEGRNILLIRKDRSPNLEVGSTKSVRLDVSETPVGRDSSTAAAAGVFAVHSGHESHQTVLVGREDEQDEKPINVDEFKVMDLERDPGLLDEIASRSSEDFSPEARQIARDHYVWVPKGPSTTVAHHQTREEFRLTLKRIK